MPGYGVCFCVNNYLTERSCQKSMKFVMLVNIRIYLFSAFLFFAVGLNSVLVRIHWKFVAGLVLICTWVAIFIAIIFSLTFSNYVLICLLLPYKNRHYNLFT